MINKRLQKDVAVDAIMGKGPRFRPSYHDAAFHQRVAVSAGHLISFTQSEIED